MVLDQRPCDKLYQEVLQSRQTNPSILNGPEFPNCTADGLFEKRQCLSLTGVCRCVDPFTGDPIEGIAEGTFSELDCSGTYKLLGSFCQPKKLRQLQFFGRACSELCSSTFVVLCR